MAGISTSPAPIPATGVVPTGEPEALAPAHVNVYDRADDQALLAVLCLSHYFNDFCLGVTAPMIPSMEAKYGMTLGAVAGIMTVITLMANFTQPIAGRLMDKCRTPWVLLLCPVVSGVSLLVGFTDTPAQACALFFLSGLAIGTFHPFAFVLAQTALPRRPAFSTSVFISCGFLGVSSGAMISGHWMEHLGFRGFHYLFPGALLVVGALLLRGIQSFDLASQLDVSHAPEPAPDPVSGIRRPRIPFGLLFALGLLMAIEGGTLLFFSPKLFQILFESEGQGGNGVFLFGLLGGLSSFFYASLGDRGNSLRVAMYVQILAIAPLFGFFAMDTIAGKLGMMALIGATLGGGFPLVAALARHARGLSVSMRSALMLGGVWGTASVIQYAMAQLPDRGHDLQDVMGLIRGVPFILIGLLSYASRTYDSRTSH